MQNFLSRTRKNSSRNSKQKFIFVAALCVCAIFLALYAKSLVQSISMTFLEPWYRIERYMQESSATIPYFVRSRNELQAQMSALENQLYALQDVNDALRALAYENEALRLEVGRPSTQLLAAGVLAQPPRTPYDTFLIDRGSVDGVVLHAPVISGSKTAIGYVTHVEDHAAVATLFSAPDVMTTVYVFGPNIFATAHGEGGGVLRVLVPQGVKISEGDLVVTPLFDVYPLGTVSRVESVVSEPDQYAFVTFPVPMKTMRTVWVGTQPLVQDTMEQIFETYVQSYTDFNLQLPPAPSSTPTTTL